MFEFVDDCIVGDTVDNIVGVDNAVAEAINAGTGWRIVVNRWIALDKGKVYVGLIVFG